MKRAISGFALALMLVSPGAADQISGGQSFAGQEQRTEAPAGVAMRAHAVHAVLRYDLSTAGACRAFSDQSPELCLLLALHVIRMSERKQQAL
jgi:hypothetical protein